MSIKVNQLTKQYDAQIAVNNISFEAHKGEIVGFLGPNGAGKTTTMKILTCYLPATSGTAEVCGYNTARNPMEVRERIGYLPEHNPLYKDMYVKEYLSFIGRLHKIANLNQRVAEMVDRTGLTREQHKPISSLSKGYRQRVGLAQAMIHNPEVLILDEPTTGLDPNQLVEIRSLIREIAAEKTVIFSTHIMQEVEALCNRVIIINRGELVANDSIEQLQSRKTGEIIITIETAETVKKEIFDKIKGIKKVKAVGNNRFQLIAAHDLRREIFTFCVQQNIILLEMHKEVSSVQDIFQSLTAAV